MITEVLYMYAAYLVSISVYVDLITSSYNYRYDNINYTDLDMTQYPSVTLKHHNVGFNGPSGLKQQQNTLSEHNGNRFSTFVYYQRIIISWDMDIIRFVSVVGVINND